MEYFPTKMLSTYVSMKFVNPIRQEFPNIRLISEGDFLKLMPPTKKTTFWRQSS